jgi:drug/metabolite transporter (DMT)-like permease
MYQHILGITLIKSIRPYFRKNIINTLESHEFLFINTITISVVLFIYFIYKVYFDKNIISDTINNCKKLSWIQTGSLIILSCFTIFSSVILIDLDKNYNTPAFNSVLLKSSSFIFLFVVGFLFYKEKYTNMQIYGIVFIIIGLVLFNYK